MWQSAETLYEPRRQPLDLLQTISVGNKVRQADLHSVLKMAPNQRVIRGGANADTDSSANDRLIINSIRLALEAASLQWMEGEKELSMSQDTEIEGSSVEIRRIFTPERNREAKRMDRGDEIENR